VQRAQESVGGRGAELNLLEFNNMIGWVRKGLIYVNKKIF
jgi:hypothetical protein